MPNRNVNITVCHLLTFNAKNLWEGLGLARDDHLLWVSTSHFCGAKNGGCTLSKSDAQTILEAVERLVRRYYAARMGGIERSIIASLEALFGLLFDAIECCLDLYAEHCVCSWKRRVGHAEVLSRFLIEVAQSYWSTGADTEWMYKDLERLACLATDVFERDGSTSRPAENDQSAKAQADRLAVRLFDAANDLSCNNWGQEDWMSVMPLA